ncbi:MAG: dihydropyrimidinase [Candidatus Eremiobacterota bacterium]
MDLLIKNGTIVTACDIYRADIAIEGEKIVLIGHNLPEDNVRIIDGEGKYIFPGAIDVHTHFQLPVAGTVSSDDFENGTKAAAAGGVTTVIDFANQEKGKHLIEGVEERRKEAEGRVAIDYSLHLCITDWHKHILKEIKETVDYGIPSFKMFMCYKSRGLMSDDEALFSALESTCLYGSLISVHAESPVVLEMLVDRYEKEKEKYGSYAHVLSRPNFIEEEAIVRAIKWAEVTGGNLYIVHMSTGEGADAVKAARDRGVKVFAETCPQYLLLDDEVFKRENGHWYATCPQVKKKKDRTRLWDGLVRKEIDVIGTDTCTFTTAQKNAWHGDFTKIPYGLPGVETMVPLIYSEGVAKGRISLNRFVSIVSTNPAKIFGLYPQKGTIVPGADADIIIFDPKKETIIHPELLQTNCDWSPYEGMTVTGQPYMTICRGKIVAEKGKFTGQTGYGRFLKRKAQGVL